jgi:hypothetical protein
MHEREEEHRVSEASVIARPRTLTERERSALLLGANLVPPAERHAYVRQVEEALVLFEDGGCLALRMPPHVDRVDAESFAIRYRDVDDEPVDLLVSFARGRLSWIDRWRDDGGDPLIDFPAPDAVESVE